MILVHKSDTVDNVILSSDKGILSYSDGDVAILQATVYDKDNNILHNKKVVFYKDEVILDTAYTDVNGFTTYESQSECNGDIRFEEIIGSLLSKT